MEGMHDVVYIYECRKWNVWGKIKSPWWIPYLSCFDVFTHKGFIKHGELRSIIVDIQDLNEDGNSSGLAGIIWRMMERDY